ncbi:MAG: FumA C-terminus/TtdB family hydratase beta subunit [Anaerolineales bacterium]|jgi:fumarate hydratase subunit beta
MNKINIPISDATIRGLKVGDPVLLNGIMLTGRDTVHKWMIDTFIRKTREPQGNDIEVYKAIKPILKDSLIYHCGPVVSGLDTKEYKFVAAGPTTSIREEPYQAEVMQHFGLKGVIGKGGMGPKTLQGCQDAPAVYFHAIGGAASLIAQRVKKVHGVYKMEFGVPEAMWIIEVEDFPVVVTMDTHGDSLHAVIQERSNQVLQDLLVN